MRKKFVSFLLIFALVLSAGCNKTVSTNGSDDPDDIPVINGTDITPDDNDNNDDNTDDFSSLINMPRVELEIVFSEDFESGDSAFTGRAGERVAIVEHGFEGGKSLVTFDRTAAWNGPRIDLTNYVEPNVLYEFSAMIKYDHELAGTPSERLTASLDVDGGFSNVAHVFANFGEWIEIKGTFTPPEEFKSFALYFEGGADASGFFPGIYLDNFVVSKVIVEKLAPDLLPSIYKVHEDFFSVGVGVLVADLRNPDSSALINHHFNSITMGNEMKPDSLLDRAGSLADPEMMPVIRTAVLDECLSYARDNGLKMRGHTLVWHSQTPSWFFKEDYSQDRNAPNVSREVMLARLEHYIMTVLTYCQENYPDVIYAWDVVNEAVDPGSKDPDKIRDTYNNAPNPWYEVVGADYVEMSFYYARKYAAPEVKLFYNDYNEYEPNKMFPIINLLAGLKEKGLVDGMGMQAHIGFSNPSSIDFQSALLRYAELGIEIQITELDIDLRSNSEEDLLQLAIRYKRLMNIFRYCVESGQANITNVTLWGLSDRDSWLNDREGGRRYPLLFDDYFYPKLAFWGFILDDSIPLF